MQAIFLDGKAEIIEVDVIVTVTSSIVASAEKDFLQATVDQLLRDNITRN